MERAGLLATAAVAGVVGGWVRDWCAGGPASAQDTALEAVTAKEFRLVDREGELRAALFTAPDGRPGLSLLDEDGRQRVSLCLLEEGAAALGLFDAEGRLRAEVAVLADGVPTLNVRDSSGANRAVLSMSAAGDAALSIADEKQRPRAQVLQDLLRIVDGSGRDRIGLAVLPDGAAALRVVGGMAESDQGVYLGVESDGAASLNLETGQGLVAAQLRQDADGHCRLVFLDSEGQPRVVSGSDDTGEWLMGLMDANGGTVWRTPAN